MRLRYRGAVIWITAAFCMGLAFPSMAGVWHQDEKGWWYQNDDGSWPAKSWKWLDGNFDGTAECYYFYPDGYMASSCVTPDGYMVNGDGAWTVNGTVQTRQEKPAETAKEDGWRHENGRWKYYENGQFLRNTWKFSDGRWYYFASDGTMASGLISISGNRYYLNSDGSLRTESFEEDGIYYQVDSSGRITGEIRNGEKENENLLAGSFDREKEQEVFQMTNEAREKEGKETLQWDDRLAECARIRSTEIGENFAHLRPDGRSWKTVIDEAGISTMAWGENIAMGQMSSDEVMEDWLNSEGHRANIMKDKYTKMGAACYVENGVCHWVQLFIQ